MSSRSESTKPGPKGPAFRLYAPTNNLATNDAAAPTRVFDAPSGLRRARVASLRFQARASGLWMETLHRSAPFRIRPRTNYARQTGRHHHPTHHQLRLPAAHVADARPASTSTKPIAHGSLRRMSPPPPQPAPPPAASRRITAPCGACRRHHPGQHQRQRRAGQSRLPAAQVAATTPAGISTSTKPIAHGSLPRMSPPPPQPAPAPAPSRSLTAPCCACRRHHPSQHQRQHQADRSRLPAAHVAAATPASISTSSDPTSHGSLLRMSPPPPRPEPTPLDAPARLIPEPDPNPSPTENQPTYRSTVQTCTPTPQRSAHQPGTARAADIAAARQAHHQQKKARLLISKCKAGQGRAGSTPPSAPLRGRSSPVLAMLAMLAAEEAAARGSAWLRSSLRGG